MAATGDGLHLLATETVATTAAGYNDPDAWESVVRGSTPQSVPDSIRIKTLQLQPFRMVIQANITNSRLLCCAIVTCEAGGQGPHSFHVIHQLNECVLFHPTFCPVHSATTFHLTATARPTGNDHAGDIPQW